MVRYLRSHGNYLTPGNGITLLSGCAVVLRGMLLNLLVWIPVLSALMALMHSAGRWNISGHRDATLDAMIEAQASEFDPEQRREQLKNIQRRVLDQGYLFSPVSSASRWVYNRDVKGFHPNTALTEYLYWSRVWLDR